MKTVQALGEQFTVTSSRIVRSSGYGQYKIEISFIDEDGDDYKIIFHSTDSQLFDKAHGEDDHDDIVFESVKYQLARAIENFDHAR